MLGTKPCLLKIQLRCQSFLNNNRIARKTRFDCNKWNINEIRNEQSLYLSSKFPGRRFKLNGTFYLCLAKVRVVCMLIRPLRNKEDHSNPGGSDKIYFTLLTYVLCIWDYSLSRGHVSEVLLIIDNCIKKLKIKSLTNGKNETTWLELSLKSFIWIVSSVLDFIDWSKPPVCFWQLPRISSNNPAKNPKHINKDLIWKRKFCLRISQSCSDRKRKRFLLNTLEWKMLVLLEVTVLALEKHPVRFTFSGTIKPKAFPRNDVSVVIFIQVF